MGIQYHIEGENMDTKTDSEKYNLLKAKSDPRLYEHAQMWHYEQTGEWIDDTSYKFWEMYQKWIAFAFADFIG